jgi:hypothetical protein
MKLSYESDGAFRKPQNSKIIKVLEGCRYLLHVANANHYYMMSITRDADTSPCRYIPLTQYDWSLSNIDNDCAGTRLPWNPTVYCVIAAFHAVTVWTAIALILMVLVTFKRWNTMYFWYDVCPLPSMDRPDALSHRISVLNPCHDISV